MTLELNHAKVSGKSDGVDTTLIQPSDWNDAHEFTLAAGKIVGRDTSGSGDAQELGLAFDTAGNADFNVGTAGLAIPTGTTGQRSGGARTGTIRYNTTIAAFEGKFASTWATLVGSISPTFTGVATFAAATFSGLLQIVGLGETIVDATFSSGTLTMDLALGTNFKYTRSANITTIAFSNAPSGKVASATLFLKNGDGVSHTDTLTSCQWAGNSPPTLSATLNSEDVIGFIVRPSVTKPYAFVGGLGFVG